MLFVGLTLMINGDAKIDSSSKTNGAEPQRRVSTLFEEPGERTLRWILATFLIAFTGWTVSVQACVLLGWNMKNLLVLAPLVMACFVVAYCFLREKDKTHIAEGKVGFNTYQVTSKFSSPLTLAALIALPAALYCSWTVFWALSTLMLTASLFSSGSAPASKALYAIEISKRYSALTILIVAVFAVSLSLAVSRSDLDDSFYVAVAAFSSSNPEHALLAGDPMLGEAGLPLLFPSYRFASFELLSGALAYVFSAPSMDFYYIYLLPVWVIASIAANFLLAKALMPRSWILVGVITVGLLLLLGEMHRSTANFSFVRIFQGKAVFLSFIVPAIFYLTARYFSGKGTNKDLFLLACCQLTAIGLSNFGMLAAPMAGFGALASNLPLALGERKKLCYGIATLVIPLPYLINVVLQAKGSPVLDFGVETSENVWTTVFGPHQQYLVGILLLAGPVLAKDTVTKWRLAVPPLILFGFYLNPWLADFISRYLTTPPVYWRVVWSFPLMTFAAVSLCMIVVELIEQKQYRWLSASLSVIVFGLVIYSLPYHTLRPDNIGKIENFASWKILAPDLSVAEKAMDLKVDGGAVLAQDEIAGVISRFEHHPRLLMTRVLYLYLLRPAIGEEEYAKRLALYNFITGKIEGNGEQVRPIFRSANVALVILNVANETPLAIDILSTEGYTRLDAVNGYSFWIIKR
ncbi:hypothetical protein PsyrCH409_18275 [Pseudomonas viridiflava]|nr:hypothetical protein PsyrCH409_18275 [Pseudomonas viridiflava]